MFIVVGMSERPLLVCPPCAETVLKLAPTGESMPEQKGGATDEQLTLL